jgi:hypothetical protein
MPSIGDTSGAAHSTDKSEGKWQVSSMGGTAPRWQRDGRELFYISADNKLMVATVDAKGSAFAVVAVRALFEVHRRVAGYRGFGSSFNYDVSPDGQRFLVNAVGSEQMTAPITLVVNWMAALKK